MSKLYTQDELDTYFQGLDDWQLRARTYAKWREEWKDRCITINYALQPRSSIKKWIIDQGIRRVDYLRSNAGRKNVKYFFRHAEDYMAAVLLFS